MSMPTQGSGLDSGYPSDAGAPHTADGGEGQLPR